MACCITPALARCSRSLPQCISGSFWSTCLVRNSISFAYFLIFEAFTSLFVEMIPFVCFFLHLILVSEPLSVFIIIMSPTLQLNIGLDHKYTLINKLSGLSFLLHKYKNGDFIFPIACPLWLFLAGCSTASIVQMAESRISDLFRKLAREQPGNIKILQRLPLNPSLRPS